MDSIGNQQQSTQSGVLTDDRPAILGGTPVFNVPVSFNQPTLPAYDSVEGDLRAAYLSGQLTNGQRVADFEAKAAEYFGRHAVAMASCTAGLILAARVLGLSGQVILPSLTFFATSHSLIWNGLTPLFVDISPDGWTIDPAAVEAAINPQVSAILAVDVYGNPCDKDALAVIADRHGLKLITDAAHALGGFYSGKPIGSFGDAEVFSLSPTKLLAAGEGGLIGVGDEQVAKQLRIARDYGNPGDYNCRFVGLNSRMTETNAIIATAGMDILAVNVQRRNQIANQYKSNLSTTPGLTWQAVDDNCLCTYKDVSVLVDELEFGLNRDALADALALEGVPTRKYYHPAAHKQSAYTGLFRMSGDLAVTERISANILSLPVFSHMEEAVVDKICLAIERIRKNTGLISAILT